MREQTSFALPMLLRFVILVLIALIVAAFVVVQPNWNWTRTLIATALGSFLLTLTLAVVAPATFGWCWRIVVGSLCTGIGVFAAYESVTQFTWLRAISAASVILFFCLPGLWFAVTGRLSGYSETDAADVSKSDDS